jgi:putative protease
MGPDYYGDDLAVTEMYDKNMEVIESAPHAQQIVYVKFEKEVKPYYILRKRKDVK